MLTIGKMAVLEVNRYMWYEACYMYRIYCNGCIVKHCQSHFKYQVSNTFVQYACTCIIIKWN